MSMRCFKCFYKVLMIIIMLLFTVKIYSSYYNDKSFMPIYLENDLNIHEYKSIVMDYSGLMWFSYLEGVASYDGYSLRTYPFRFDNKRRLITDHKGNVYVYGEQSKTPIFSYDIKKDRFVEMLSLESPYNVSVNSMVIDSNGNIVIATNSGIFSYNEEKDELVYFMKYRKENFLKVNVLDTGKYVFVSKEKIIMSRLDFENEEVIDLDGMLFDGNSVNTLYALNGMLYIGTKTGVYIYEYDDKLKFKTHILDGCFVRAVVQKTSSTILIGTDGRGIYEVEKNDFKTKSHYSPTLENSYIKSNAIYDLFIDNYDRVWCATYQDGIHLYDPRRKGIRAYPIGDSNNAVNGILEDSKKDILWFATNTGVYNQTDEGIHNLLPRKDGRGTSLSLCKDDDYIYVGEYGSGISKIKLDNTKSVTKLKANSPAVTNYVFSLLNDGGYIWSGGIYGEFSKICKGNGYVDLLGNGIVYCIIDDYDKVIANIGFGLFSIKKRTLHKKDILKDIVDKHADLFKEYPLVNCFKKHDDLFYIGTSNVGFIIYDTNNDDCKVIPTNYGVMSVELDNDKNVWISTTNGLAYIDKVSTKVTFLGFNKGQFVRQSSCHTSDNMILFGTTSGVISVSPQKVIPELNREKDYIRLTDLKILYKSIKENDSKIEDAVDDLKDIELEYNQNTFSFEFIDLNYSHLKQVYFIWKLENYNDSWSAPVKHGTVSFTNVPPGKYKFVLRTVDGLSERVVNVVIKQPWWLSPLAFATYVMLLLMIVLWGVRYYYLRLKRKHSEEKLRFFIDASHDIRTPLTLIHAPLMALRREPNLSSSSQYMLHMIECNVNKLNNIINNILDYESLSSSKHELKYEWYSLNGLIKEHVDNFVLMAQTKDIKINYRLQEPDITTKIEIESVTTVIENLLSNAIKYSLPGGEIVVSTFYNDKHWELSVKDNGIGIPEKEKKNLFNGYFRARNAINSTETGSGVGMMIVFRLVNELNGDISFKSKEGEGTEFIVRIPIIEKVVSTIEKTETDVDGEVEEEKAQEEFIHAVLVVDDNPEIIDFLSIYLSSDYKIRTATSASEAFDVLKKENINIVVSDVMMEGENGFSLCERIKSDERLMSVPVILLSALSDNESVIHGLKVGADDYVTKPFDPEFLKVKIRNLLSYKERIMKYKESDDATVEETVKIEQLNEMDKLFITNLNKAIEDNISNHEFNVDVLSKIMCMSRSVLYSRIKNLSLSPINDLIKEARMKKAAELLLTGMYSIADVADMTGFADSKYFSTVFGKHYGCSPSKYKK